MYKQDSNCTSETNWFDLAETPCLEFKRKLLNAFNSIEAILASTFEEEPLGAYCWAQSTVPSSGNLYQTDAVREGRGIDINNVVFSQHWPRYLGMHSWFHWDLG